MVSFIFLLSLMAFYPITAATASSLHHSGTGSASSHLRGLQNRRSGGGSSAGHRWLGMDDKNDKDKDEKDDDDDDGDAPVEVATTAPTTPPTIPPTIIPQPTPTFLAVLTLAPTSLPIAAPVVLPTTEEEPTNPPTSFPPMTLMTPPPTLSSDAKTASPTPPQPTSTTASTAIPSITTAPPVEADGAEKTKAPASSAIALLEFRVTPSSSISSIFSDTSIFVEALQERLFTTMVTDLPTLEQINLEIVSNSSSSNNNNNNNNRRRQLQQDQTFQGTAVFSADGKTPTTKKVHESQTSAIENMSEETQDVLGIARIEVLTDDGTDAAPSLSTSSTSNSGGGGPPAGLIVGIVMAVLLLIGLTVGYFVYRRYYYDDDGADIWDVPMKRRAGRGVEQPPRSGTPPAADLSLEDDYSLEDGFVPRTTPQEETQLYLEQRAQRREQQRHNRSNRSNNDDDDSSTFSYANVGKDSVAGAGTTTSSTTSSQQPASLLAPIGQNSLSMMDDDDYDYDDDSLYTKGEGIEVDVATLDFGEHYHHHHHHDDDDSNGKSHTGDSVLTGYSDFLAKASKGHLITDPTQSPKGGRYSSSNPSSLLSTPNPNYDSDVPSDEKNEPEEDHQDLTNFDIPTLQHQQPPPPPQQQQRQQRELKLVKQAKQQRRQQQAIYSAPIMNRDNCGVAEYHGDDNIEMEYSLSTLDLDCSITTSEASSPKP